MNNYVKNTSWILIEKMSRIISGILVGILVARYLGPGQLGTISYALNVVAIFTVFSTLGLDSIVVRELLVRREEEQVILGTSFIMRFVGSLTVVAGSCFYSYLRDKPDQTFIVFLVSTAIVMQSLSVIDFYFQAKVKGKLTAINQIITLLTSAVVKIILILCEAPLPYFAGMVLFEAALTAFNQYLFYRHNGNQIRLWSFSWAEAKILLLHAWPIIISSFVLMVYQKMDQVLIKRFLDLDMVGQYSAALRVSEASYFIPVAISAAVFPGIVNARLNREFQLVRLTQLMSLIMYSSIAVTVGGLLFGDHVIHFMFGNKFPLSPSIFLIHIWAVIPIFYGTAWGMWIVSENKQIYLMVFQFFSLALCLFLNLKLIPLWGVKGAAVSTVVTYYFGIFNTILFYKPRESFRVLVQSLDPMHIPAIFNYVKESRSR